MSHHSFPCCPTWHENKFQAGAKDARSNDTGRLKTVVTNWLNTCGHSDARLSARASLCANKKEQRGINHDVTGHLLCPINYDWNDPVYVLWVLLVSSIPSTPHLVYVPTSETLLQATTMHVDSSSVVCTWMRVEMLRTLKRGFWKAPSLCTWVFGPPY